MPLMPLRVLLRHHIGEWHDVSLQIYEDAHQRDERETMEEDEFKDASFVAIPIGGGAGDDDALCGHHLAHDSAGAVCRGHKYWADTKLIGGDFLKAAEEYIGGSIRSCHGDAEPTEQGTEEWVKPAGVRESEAECGVSAGEFRDIAQCQHSGDGEER